MSEKSNLAAPLIAGFVVVLTVGGVLLYAPGREHIATGIVWGVAVAYLGFLLYYFLIPRPGSSGAAVPFIRGYLLGAALRYIFMIGAFCAVVFWMHIDTIGVLIGAFAGMMTSTFLSLGKMKQVSPESPQTRAEKPEG